MTVSPRPEESPLSVTILSLDSILRKPFEDHVEMSSRSLKHVAMFEIILPPFLVGWGRPSSWETCNERLFGGLLLILIQQKPGERLYLKTLQSNSVSNDLQTRFRLENRKY